MIRRFSATLLPELQEDNNLPAVPYSKGLLQLHAKYDEPAILLGLLLNTRFMSNRYQPVTIKRQELIKRSGLEQLNNQKKKRATEALKKHLDKLKGEPLILSHYLPEEFGQDEEENITFYPVQGFSAPNEIAE